MCDCGGPDECPHYLLDGSKNPVFWGELDREIKEKNNALIKKGCVPGTRWLYKHDRKVREPKPSKYLNSTSLGLNAEYYFNNIEIEIKNSKYNHSYVTHPYFEVEVNGHIYECSADINHLYPIKNKNPFVYEWEWWM